MPHFLDRLLSPGLGEFFVTPVVQNTVVKPVLVDRSQLAFEGQIEIVDDFRIRAHQFSPRLPRPALSPRRPRPFFSFRCSAPPSRPGSLRISAYSPATCRRRTRAWGRSASPGKPEYQHQSIHYKNKRSCMTPGRWRPAQRISKQSRLEKEFEEQKFRRVLRRARPIASMGSGEV